MKRLLVLVFATVLLLLGTALLGAQENAAEHARARAFAGKFQAEVNTTNTKTAPAINTLDLGSKQVSDQDLYILDGLTELRDLYLDGTQVTNAGLVHLGNLKKLNMLDLANSQIGDAGLAHLKHLTGLRSLFLDRTQVTDAGLVHLKEMKLLQMIDLTGSKCTKNGITELRKALPKVTISH